MTDLSSLKNNIETLVFDRNSSFFHNIIQSLAESLDFSFEGEWIEADPYDGPPVVFPSKLDLDIAYAMAYFKNYAFNKKHVKDDVYLISTTHHSDKEMLDSGIYTDKSVMSNSLLGLNKEVIPFEQLKTKFPARGKRDSLDLAFENDKIIINQDHYFFHINQLYELAEKKLSQ